jgi:hypothetical protein
MKVFKARRDSANRPEQQWTQKLRDEARNWQSAKPDQNYRTEPRSPVVRRHKRRVTKQAAA